MGEYSKALKYKTAIFDFLHAASVAGIPARPQRDPARREGTMQAGVLAKCCLVRGRRGLRLGDQRQASCRSWAS